MTYELGGASPVPDPRFDEARLQRADELMHGGPEKRREAMLIYRELIDRLRTDDDRGAARIAEIARSPGAVDPAFEPLFGQVAATTTDPAILRATTLAAAQLAMERSDYLHAEAALRRNLRRADTPARRMNAFHRLAAVWSRQGMEHEATVASRRANEVPATEMEDRSNCHAHTLSAHVARADWRAAARESELWEESCAALPRGCALPSRHSVALAASRAHLRLGNVPAARTWLDRVRPDLAEPSHAEALHPMVALHAAGIAAAAGDVARAADAGLQVARDLRSGPQLRAEAMVLALECLSRTGVTLRAAVVAADWATLLAAERQRLGSGVVVRMVTNTLPTVIGVTPDRDVHRTLRRVAWDAIADRVEELSRHTDDADVPTAPDDEPPLREFRLRFDTARGTVAAPPAEDPATHRVLAILGRAWRLCGACLRVNREHGRPLPVGHLIAGFAGRARESMSCAACSTTH